MRRWKWLNWVHQIAHLWLSCKLPKQTAGSSESRIMFVIVCIPKKRTTSHHLEFFCPFAPSQSPPILQKHHPLPFCHRKKVPNIVSTCLPVFQCLFFPGQRYACSLTANLLLFLTVLAAFSAFPPFFVCSLALRFEWLI